MTPNYSGLDRNSHGVCKLATKNHDVSVRIRQDSLPCFPCANCTGKLKVLILSRLLPSFSDASTGESVNLFRQSIETSSPRHHAANATIPAGVPETSTKAATTTRTNGEENDGLLGSVKPNGWGRLGQSGTDNVSSPSSKNGANGANRDWESRGDSKVPGPLENLSGTWKKDMEVLAAGLIEHQCDPYCMIAK